MGPDPAGRAALRAAPMRADNRHEIVVLPTPSPDDEEALRKLAADGHRVFRIAASEADFENLDALRRAQALGATLVLVRDAEWQPLAGRLRAELNWPHVETLSEGATPAAAFPLLSIVVVTYGTAASIGSASTASSLARSGRTSRSSRSTTARPTARASSSNRPPQRDARIRPIFFADNRGYPAAANAGLAAARGESVVLLNNDTVVTRGWATALLRHLARDRNLGLVGPVTNAIANDAKVDVGYRELDALPDWADSWTRAHDGETFPISSLAFFCVAMPREVYERVGALDERFGLGMFEDGDYNRRVRAAGYDVRCARDSFVHHWQMASFRRLGKDAYVRLFAENRRKFEEKWRS